MPQSDRRFGNYRVVEELSSGGLCTVYRGEHVTLGRAVAVKALKSSILTTSPFAAQLEREARVLAELNHPNIVMLFEFVKSEGEMYLVTELVDGFPLSQLLSKSVPLAPPAAALVASRAARALGHAHARGIVHRDVKPDNVLLSKRGDVKITDFGIAQRERLPTADEPLARADDSTPFGSPAYMSPEQTLGEDVDARSDIFSLGAVFYEMLTGERPFGESVARASSRSRHGPPPVRGRAPNVPRALERVAMKALERHPADRYASADAMADALDEYLASLPAFPRDRLIVRALVKCRLVEDPLAESIALRIDEPPRSLRPVMLGFGLLFAVGLAGGAFIQVGERSPRDYVGGRDGPLQLMPDNPGYLRVVATPWAEVAVDGQGVATTPVARAFPLAAGTHYVSFFHPNAPPEKRVVEITSGEVVWVDVTMDINVDEDEREAKKAVAAESDKRADNGDGGAL